MTSPMRVRFVPILGVLVAIGCGGAKPQEASAKTEQPAERPLQLAEATTGGPNSAQGSATIKGSVKFTGTPPTPTRIKMDADPQCALQHKAPVNKPDVVVNSNGTLKHVFVYVKDGASTQTSTATKSVTLSQQGCLYEPHVFGVQVNQPLDIVNNDETLHNVNCKPTKSKPFNVAQPTKGMKTTAKFTAPEVMVKCVCNIHPWMAAYIGVVDNPYYGVTGDDGSFSLANVPAGNYTIEAWHEKYGTQTQTVSVKDGETKEMAFEFKGQ